MSYVVIVVVAVVVGASVVEVFVVEGINGRSSRGVIVAGNSD